jgi:hypothetical protein
MNPINWQIFAWTVGAVSVFVAIAAAYALGHDKGKVKGRRDCFSEAQRLVESRIGVAERNAEVRGVRKGIEQQKAVHAAREKDAARRGPGGRFTRKPTL